MRERLDAPSNSYSNPQKYYFQVVVSRLISKQSINKASSTFSFAFEKCNHQFDITKNIKLNFGPSNAYPLDDCKVNCTLFTRNLIKQVVYNLKMFEESIETGQCEIDANSYLERHIQSRKGAFTQRVSFNHEWAADLELYFEKSRQGLENMVRDYKKPRKENESPLTYQTLIPDKRGIKMEKKREQAILEEKIERTRPGSRVQDVPFEPEIRPPVVNQHNSVDKWAISPKYITLVALFLILLYFGSSFLRSKPQELPPPPPSKPQKKPYKKQSKPLKKK